MQRVAKIGDSSAPFGRCAKIMKSNNSHIPNRKEKLEKGFQSNL